MERDSRGRVRWYRSVGGSDLRKTRDNPQMRVAVPIPRPPVRSRAADLEQYMESDTLHVLFQSALGSAKAFEQGWYRKTALCSSSVEQAHDDWMAGLMRAGTTALSSPTVTQAHAGALDSLPPPAKCAFMHAHTVHSSTHAA